VLRLLPHALNASVGAQAELETLRLSEKSSKLEVRTANRE
jgi:hypothetical protein